MPKEQMKVTVDFGNGVVRDYHPVGNLPLDHVMKIVVTHPEEMEYALVNMIPLNQHHQELAGGGGKFERSPVEMVERLAAAYTKALCQHPDAKIFANIERAYHEAAGIRT